MRTYANFKKYERMLLTVIAKTNGYMKESEAQEDRKESSMGEVKPPASGKKKGHKDQLLKPLPKSGLKLFEYFQHLLEELPQADRTDKEKLKRYLPYSDALPAYCKAPDQETNN